MDRNYLKRPAIVRYLGGDDEGFTVGKKYEAYFVEYWNGIRNNLHVQNDEGEITDWIEFGNFKVLEDPDGVLSFKEAVVQCITNHYEALDEALTFGMQYKAIGRDRNGWYLVMDNSGFCYFYPPDAFKVISDPDGILKDISVYYCGSTDDKWGE